MKISVFWAIVLKNLRQMLGYIKPMKLILLKGRHSKAFNESL